MRAITLCLLILALTVVSPAAQTRPVKTLDIYVVDVEGGNATLFVSPSGQSVLIDAPRRDWLLTQIVGNGVALVARNRARLRASCGAAAPGRRQAIGAIERGGSTG